MTRIKSVFFKATLCNCLFCLLEALLTFNKVLNGKLGPEVRSLIEPSKAPRQNLRETSFPPFKLQKTKLKLTDSNFIHRATRLANFVSMKHNINFYDPCEKVKPLLILFFGIITLIPMKGNHVLLSFNAIAVICK